MRNLVHFHVKLQNLTKKERLQSFSLGWFGEIGKNVAYVNMWLKCIDRGNLNHTLAGLNLWLSDWRIRACRVSPGFCVGVKCNVFLSFHTDILTLLCIHFFCTLFLLNFLNFPLVDNLVLLTELRICYPIKVNYCLSSIFSFCLWGFSFFNLTYTPTRFIRFICGKQKTYQLHTHTEQIQWQCGELTQIYKQA